MLMPLREVRCVCNGLRLRTGGPECKWTQGRVVGTGGSQRPGTGRPLPCALCPLIIRHDESDAAFPLCYTGLSPLPNTPCEGRLPSANTNKRNSLI